MAWGAYFAVVVRDVPVDLTLDRVLAVACVAQWALGAFVVEHVQVVFALGLVVAVALVAARARGTVAVLDEFVLLTRRLVRTIA